MRAKARAKRAPAESLSSPTFAQAQSRWMRRLGLWVAGIISVLSGLNGLYSRYAYLRYFKPGVHHFNQHQYQRAEKDFQSYLHLNNEPDGHYFLGRTFLAEGKLPAARAEFLRDGVVVPAKMGPIWFPNNRSISYLHQLRK